MVNDIVYKNDKIYIENVSCFDLAKTLDCGQAFRWEEDENGRWHGIAGGKYATLFNENGKIVIENVDKRDFEDFFLNYFDLERDYDKILSDMSVNEKINAARIAGHGIRILNQEPFEALISFIISQNNNIPRIKGIIKRLCENFGEKTEGGYTFPSPSTLASLEIEDLAALRSGFRAKYIIDAARKVSSGEINLEHIKTLDIDKAREALMTIKGVGPKVADCAMLYGMGFINAFPKDVWIKRALLEYFDGTLPDCAKEYAGIAQQYIFYYIRTIA
ncbi:MAG: DNA-3-methyladenine glycosylase 2 family protein [Clostridia bacterium]|nr:DNA-3-methyladenine glycosylase 2 family protein [Clostridia bacterium]